MNDMIHTVCYYSNSIYCPHVYMIIITVLYITSFSLT